MLNERVSGDVFDADYLYFAAAFQTPAANEDETDLIVRLLDLHERNDVLDACSGAGRIANRLAVRGQRVVAIDHNRTFCDLGAAEAASLGVQVDYRCEDIRQLDDEACFDAVVCWFSSFGYWDDRTNADVLRRFRQALRVGGRLLLDLPNPALILRQLGPEGAPVRRIRRVGEHDLMDDELRVDLESGCLQVARRISRAGRDRTVHWACRLYAPAELAALLAGNRFTISALVGDDGQPLHADSSRQLVVATAA